MRGFSPVTRCMNDSESLFVATGLGAEPRMAFLTFPSAARAYPEVWPGLQKCTATGRHHVTGDGR